MQFDMVLYSVLLRVFLSYGQPASIIYDLCCDYSVPTTNSQLFSLLDFTLVTVLEHLLKWVTDNQYLNNLDYGISINHMNQHYISVRTKPN